LFKILKMRNKLLLLFFKVGLMFLCVSSINAQTITEKPIYNGANRLTISELSGGAIYFGYQNPEYTTIIDIVSFTAGSKSKALQLIEKAITILGMAKTDKEQHIKDSFEGVQLVRYGFWQKRIFLSNGNDRGLDLTLKDCNKIKNALEIYEYKHQSIK